MTTHPWPEPHKARLRALVDDCASWQAVADGMRDLRPDITPDAARVRACRMGMNLGVAGAPWTEAQDRALTAGIEGLVGWSAITAWMQTARPGATRDAVRERARRLGICDEGEPWA